MSANERPGEAATSTGPNTKASIEIVTTTACAGQHRVPRKWERFLRAILDRPRTSRELQLAPVYDHVAHSTASELRRKGITLEVERVRLPGYAGTGAFVARYSVAPHARELAERLLARADRGQT